MTNFERVPLSALLDVARLNDTPIVVELVRRIEHDRALIDELSTELDRIDANNAIVGAK